MGKAEHPLSTNRLTPALIAARLALAHMPAGQAQVDFPYPNSFLPGEPRPAAVLIPFLCRDGAWHILFTRRHAGLAEHSGQVAFPGGRADEEDSGPEDTAKREAFEEIGLYPKDVQVLGRLNDYITITNYRVTPVVGLIPWPYEFRPAVAEVDRVFSIPLEWLADPRNYELRPRPLPAPYPPVTVIYFSPYDGETLWGVSAALTLALLKILLNK